MCVSITLIFGLLLVNFVECASIITRSMIKMPQNLYSSSGPPGWASVSPRTDKLSSVPDNNFQRIYPFSPQEETSSLLMGRSLQPHPVNDLQNRISSTVASTENTSDSTTSSFEDIDFNRNSIIEEHDKVDHYGQSPTHNHEGSKTESLNEGTRHFNSTLTSKELSTKYWGQYNNFSSDFFSSSLQHPNNGFTIDKGFPDTTIWEFLQRMYLCVWSLGLVPCLQESFGAAMSSENSYLQFMVPRLPRVQQDGLEDYSDSNDRWDLRLYDQDEGRKKLSKKLQLIIPILLVLTVTMLPALAVLALVSGKAFLLSLMSLGVAVVATFFQPLARGADKRHEIVPQAPISTGPSPNHYYMM